MKDKVIEESYSPWRAQVVVVKKDPKLRLCIYYSQTVNKFTEEDVFPIPRIDDLINNLAQSKYFSKYDLKSAYHQVPLIENNNKYTAFEANGKLYQFRRIPFGICNAVGAFQRIITKIVDEDNLENTNPYLDDFTIAANSLPELKENSKRFEESCKKRNMAIIKVNQYVKRIV